MRPIHLFSLAVAAALLSSCGTDTAGTGSQAGNAIEFAVLTSNGNPAAAARLQIHPQSYSPWDGGESGHSDTLLIIDTLLSSNGEIELTLPEGEWVAEVTTNSEGWRTSWREEKGSSPLHSLQLQPLSRLVARLSNNSTAQIAAIAGTTHLAYLDSSTGSFEFPSLPAGPFTLLLIDTTDLQKSEKLEPIDLPANELFEMETDWETAWLWDFGARGLDSSVWAIDTGMGPDGDGWGNEHLSAATRRPENLELSDSSLTIVARIEEWGEATHTTGRIKTKNAFSWKYGRFEARVKLPSQAGLLALLSLHSNGTPYGVWPKSGSIDIFSFWKIDKPGYYGLLHWWDSENEKGIDEGPRCAITAGEEEAWHTTALEWRPPGHFEWFLDGVSCGVVENRPTPFDHSYYIRLELMVGGNPSGNPPPETTFPQRLEIDYLSVSPWRDRVID